MRGRREDEDVRYGTGRCFTFAFSAEAAKWPVRKGNSSPFDRTTCDGS